MPDASVLDALFSILDRHKYAIVFVDNDHVIRYLNRAAVVKYKKRGHDDLLNKSIFDCHNSGSKTKIIALHEEFKKGADEFFLIVNREKQKVFMVAVRNDKGELLGYYERFEDIHDSDHLADK